MPELNERRKLPVFKSRFEAWLRQGAGIKKINRRTWKLRCKYSKLHVKLISNRDNYSYGIDKHASRKRISVDKAYINTGIVFFLIMISWIQAQ